jgi:hypothetical protein
MMAKCREVQRTHAKGEAIISMNRHNRMPHR